MPQIYPSDTNQPSLKRTGSPKTGTLRRATPHLKGQQTPTKQAPSTITTSIILHTTKQTYKNPNQIAGQYIHNDDQTSRIIDCANLSLELFSLHTNF